MVYWAFSWYFQLSQTYPPTVFIPSSATSAVVTGSAQFRSKGRFPALSYYHKSTKVSVIVLSITIPCDISQILIECSQIITYSLYSNQELIIIRKFLSDPVMRILLEVIISLGTVAFRNNTIVNFRNDS